MSNALFPNLPLICAGMQITPLWKTQKSGSSSGRQFALSKRVYPNYSFKVPFTVLKSKSLLAEYQTLRGFFNSRKGGADDFLFKVPFESAVTNQSFGIGDGTTVSFPLLFSLGEFVEPVGGVDSASLVVKVNGTTTAVTLSADLRTVTFASAPAASAALIWSGIAYVRCRFTKDELPFKIIARGLYSTSCEFESFQA